MGHTTETNASNYYDDSGKKNIYYDDIDIIAISYGDNNGIVGGSMF